MNSNAFVNRIEILIYSSLISAMSGISQLRAHLQHSPSLPVQAFPEIEVVSPYPVAQTKERSWAVSWGSIKETLVSLLLWVVLGFAAGFLIGMIRPG